MYICIFVCICSLISNLYPTSSWECIFGETEESNRNSWGLFSSVQLLSRVQLFVTPWTAAHQAFLSITSSWSLPKLMFDESMVPSSHLILCRPLLLLPSIFPSIRVFSNEAALWIRWPKYWRFQLQHQSFQWTPRTYLLQDGLVGSPCSTRDSQESSPTL